jgi:hypothetical protein
MVFTLYEFQIPSFNSMIESLIINVIVTSISTLILLLSRKNNSQFYPALDLQSSLATSLISTTSDSVSIVYSLISSSLLY